MAINKYLVSYHSVIYSSVPSSICWVLFKQYVSALFSVSVRLKEVLSGCGEDENNFRVKL